MRVTLSAAVALGGSPIDVEVLPGTALRELIAATGARDSEWWCGRERLSEDHAAGVYPLLHGALLTAEPASASAQPTGPHLAVIAGPDAGGLVALSSERVIGRSSPDARLHDGALSRVHASAGATRDVVWIRDAGSTNGVRGVADAAWPGIGGAARRELRLRDGATARLGDSWLQARGLPGGSGPPADVGSPREELGKRGSVMIGAGVSAVVLAGITGRWYLALLALIYPAIILGPHLARRWRLHDPGTVDSLPDPTRPGSAPAALGVAVLGEEPRRAALARAEVLARGRRPPEHVGGFFESWMEWLPGSQPGDAPLVLADVAPSWAARVLTPTPSGTAVTTDGVRAEVPARLAVSEPSAELCARRIAGSRFHAELPRTARWADLDVPPDPVAGAPRSLMAPLGLACHEGALPSTWMLDLDAMGPHVLIAGTTGSGKSALLETLVLALAERSSPTDLQIALFDFKGGAGLGGCMSLPHVGGVVTDLDGRGARRALAALGVELTRRKAELAARGLSSFALWESAGGAPPRLLVVIDEFQEIGATHRDFMPQLTRLAAQGRALGMHLVLATQRPSGAVTPDIRANTGVTIALRVASEAESRDLIGTSAAALIPADVPGRAIVASGEARVQIHVALPIATPSPRVRIVGAPDNEARASLLERVVAKHGPAGTAAAPLWHPALPPRVALDELEPSGGIPLGLVDRASERSRSTLGWIPAAGPLVVVGAPGDERARALRCAAAGAELAGLRAVWLPPDPREAARTLALAADADEVLILVEDATAALATLAAVDRGAAAEALIARAASARPTAIGIGAGSPHRIAAHASMRVILAGTSSQDDALWSVPRELQDIPPGPGVARSWDSAGWGEALIAEPPGHAGEVLAHRLPARVRRFELRAPGAVGIGGDDAREFTAPAEGVAVVGPPGRERDGIARLLESAGAREAACFDSIVVMPPRARDGIVLVVAPTPRLAEDLCRGRSAGLVDPNPPEGRVLWVQRGQGHCVQLAVD